MRKLCLILTVLYAIWANCSAQSSLNIAKNLLEGNSSTFESGMGSWTCNDNNACSIASESGRNGKYLKLTNTGAVNDYDKQMEYSLSGHTPAKGTRYVIKFWAKSNGASEKGNIKVLLQKNNSDEKYPQIAFGGKSISIEDTWKQYEYDLITDRGDYEVIKINFGKCGEVWIDDIEYGEYTDYVVPTFTTNLETSYTVGQGGTLTLSVEASGTPAPAYQWYRNTTNSNENGATIDDATSATYSVPTETKNTYYYYCVAKNAAGNIASNVATVYVTDSILVTGLSLTAPDAMNVGTNAQCNLIITPENATNKNVIWESSAPSIIEVDQKGNLTAKSTGTATITVSSVDGEQHVSKEIKVNASTSTNGTVVDGGLFYMVQDFGNATVGATWKIEHSDPNIKEHGFATIVADPAGQKGNVLKYEAGNNDHTEYLVFHCKLPSGAKLSDYKKLVFDYKMGPLEANYKDIKIYWSGVTWNENNYPTFKSGNEQGADYPWHTAQISLDNQPTPNSNEFDIYIGGIPTFHFTVYLSNVRLAIGDYNQNDFSNTWSKVESETLYVTGSGPMPDFNGNQPWSAKNNSITKVIVSENITAIGNNAFNGLTQDNVVIILKSIPDRFGDNCFKNSNDTHTRILQLELHDEEKPYISKTKALNFPTFDKTTYFRDVKSNYSTVCLPFPISQTEVSNKGANLYDFKSMGKATVGGEDQYTLEFKGHTGGMEAGQPYLIGSGNFVLSNDEGTTVGPSAFNLTPTKVTKSVENTDVSITMEGVFQPVVIAEGNAYGFLGGKFYMNGGNMSVRPMRASFNGSQLYSAPVQGGQQQSGAKKMPKMFNFEIVPDNVTNISSPAFIAEDFNIEEVYSPSGMKTESLNKGLNIIRTSTGRVLKVMVK